jgi:hypothetical protein
MYQHDDGADILLTGADVVAGVAIPVPALIKEQTSIRRVSYGIRVH